MKGISKEVFEIDKYGIKNILVLKKKVLKFDEKDIKVSAISPRKPAFRKFKNCQKYCLKVA